MDLWSRPKYRCKLSDDDDGLIKLYFPASLTEYQLAAAGHERLSLSVSQQLIVNLQFLREFKLDSLTLCFLPPCCPPFAATKQIRRFQSNYFSFLLWQFVFAEIHNFMEL